MENHSEVLSLLDTNMQGILVHIPMKNKSYDIGLVEALTFLEDKKCMYKFPQVARGYS